MTAEFEYIGDINNWMDLRDNFIDFLQECDTELKFNRFITGVIMSAAFTPEQVIETRKQLGVKTNKKDKEILKKWYTEVKENG